MTLSSTDGARADRVGVLGVLAFFSEMAVFVLLAIAGWHLRSRRHRCPQPRNS